MCLIWKTIAHILRKLKQLKIQQMIEGLPKDAGLRSAETSPWEWGPKVWEKKHDSQIPTASAFFPGIFSKDLQKGRSSRGSGTLVGCWCKELPFAKLGSFRTTLLIFSWLMFCCSRLLICACLCIHCIPRYSSVSVYFLGTCREVAPLD